MPASNNEIRLKIQNTVKNKYNRQHQSQNHYSDDVYKIITDKCKFVAYINKIPESLRTIYYVADDLGIYWGTIFKYVRQYNIMFMFPNNDGSLFEKSVVQFVKSLNVKYKLRSRTIISPYELDIYIPEKGVAIECNGTFWHSSKIQNDNKYHYNKSKLCEEKGIRLIHIWEYEWDNERQRPILENIIKNALGINENKIYARKCRIVLKESREMKEFFNENNIQGFRGGKFAICLEYNNEIVMSYMMGHPYFGKGKYEWEVIRGATKLGYTIIGGASKIFKYFIKNYNPKNCVYYIDYNYFNGNSLKNLPDMKFIKTQPGFKNYFIDENKVRNRDPMNHSKIKQLELEGKVLPIYNAGTKVYIWYNKTLLDG